jgi:hypothetical protein
MVFHGFFYGKETGNIHEYRCGGGSGSRCGDPVKGYGTTPSSSHYSSKA